MGDLEMNQREGALLRDQMALGPFDEGAGVREETCAEEE